jgi:uncharacterized membrane protein
MLTHIPIIGIFIGIGIMIYGLLIKNETLLKVSLTLFIIMAILMIPSYFTGEWSKLIIEKKLGVSDKIIQSHESFAVKAVFLMLILMILAIINFIFINKKHTYSNLLTIIILIFSIIIAVVMTKVGDLGGQIRHTEINTASSIYQSDQ